MLELKPEQQATAGPADQGCWNRESVAAVGFVQCELQGTDRLVNDEDCDFLQAVMLTHKSPAVDPKIDLLIQFLRQCQLHIGCFALGPCFCPYYLPLLFYAQGWGCSFRQDWQNLV